MGKLIRPDNEAPSNVTDHPFTAPDGEPWGRCTFEGCGLAESVHSVSATPFEPTAETYRCPDCVMMNIDPCTHERPS